MKDKLLKLTVLTITLLAIWILYEVYRSKNIIENTENIEVLDATINTNVLGDLKNKYSF